MGTRITIDSLTCLLANESDPSRLIASSPGKLTRYLLPDGSHVQNDQPYAEVEVRQICIEALHALHAVHASHALWSCHAVHALQACILLHAQAGCCQDICFAEPYAPCMLIAHT